MAADPRTKATFVFALAIIACGAVVFARWPVSPPVNKSLYDQVGRTLALEGLKLLKTGGKVTIIARDTEEYRQPGMSLAVASVGRELRRAGAEIRSIEALQLDPIRPVEVAAGDFYEVLRRSSAGDVIISLLGPPNLSDEQKVKLGRPKASVVALCATTANPEALVKSGWLDVALVNRSGAEGKGFDALYRVLRAGTAATSASL